MNNMIMLLSVAVVAIGLFAMPNTVSIFTGQHTWKNITEIASDNGCRKCHEDVYEETHGAFNQVHWRLPGTKGSQDVFSCQECHNVTNVSAYFQSGIVNTSEAHAATTIACLSCHSGLKGLKAGGNVCFSCHNGAFRPTVSGSQQFPMHALAYKYGMGHPEDDPVRSCAQCHRVTSTYTDTGDIEAKKDNVFIKLVNATITGADEAHTTYYYQSKYPDNQTTIKLKDANSACLGCHSHAGVNVTWRRSIGYEMTVNTSTAGKFDVNVTGISSTMNVTTTSGT
ncbi:Cytochrome c7 c [uncultured archaeon]|nr:Cytochrome c7 c [uncultured archaeon]